MNKVKNGVESLREARAQAHPKPNSVRNLQTCPSKPQLKPSLIRAAPSCSPMEPDPSLWLV